ncbi:DUF4136 domain-containing protein [Compostibacter hankyongensis]|uniref:DUF4136 domain-containing protein n=1 Tax=Compostibacter hankyongensis TaxID=1007089 RepID=A0ABP8FNB6_9BACT
MKKPISGLLLGALPVLLLALNSCRKDPLKDMTREESRVYTTNYDSTADFSDFKTFSIVDSVAVISNGDEPQRELSDADAHLLKQIRTQLEQRGYTYVKKDQEPDLGINVTLISNEYLNVVPNPYPWWSFPGYWDPFYWGYGGYSYYFPPAFSLLQSQEDLMTIDMIDLKDAQKGSDKELDAVWNAVLRGEDVLNSDNYESEVKAVFDQSPYLEASGSAAP